MTLRRKMGMQIAAMIVGLLLVGATALWGLDAVHEDYGLAVTGYQELREVYEVGSHLATARTYLQPEHADRARARAEVENAAARFSLFGRGAGASSVDAASSAAVAAALAEAGRQLAVPPEVQNGDTLSADSLALSRAISKISALASGIRATIEAHQKSAQHRHDQTTRAVAVVSVAVVAGALLLGLVQYRGVMSPLARLRSGVRKIAAGEFAERLTPVGRDEFAELAQEFNRMASELDAFYHQLEQKVEQKSRELVRSERLASVGYLAAGVAHEINNPLGIISGYAEYSLGQIKSGAADAGADVAKSLQIICDEAFRCKDITSKLLSLARQGNENRAPLCLADVAEQVVALVGGLPEYRGRKVHVAVPTDPAQRRRLTVNAVEAEMKQVVLNLTLNALQACGAAGEVVIDVHRDDGQVELSVSDSGQGMTHATLQRVFEPFFTEHRGSSDSRGSRTHGTGLGLSISHAIVQSHGGVITAHSPGPGQGSRFVVRLAAVEGE